MAVISAIRVANRLASSLSLLHSGACCGMKFPERIANGEEASLCATSFDKGIYKIDDLNNHIIVVDLEDCDEPGKVEIFTVNLSQTDVMEQNSSDAERLMSWENRGPIRGTEVSESYKAEYLADTEVWTILAI
ncbi:hypothetical protein AOL_s00173g222 [Orbilia oligospora ATCC 24927]|uniref:Uncharacterized protein n=1 Tax=Arthrobotrys oligospora (strain ATCC 24927 / CBS 115.81 / DSM 1491) TaxID=756982 RepID=G1XP54_ARTOA|nr:hypothetical protein AOL_s00173g222 [Orbilia oligospora ATCC 24927]EGX45121.1 hypothetical protein AOL_s00173g222 [Orbilia oligospora ATCC 24927]